MRKNRPEPGSWWDLPVEAQERCAVANIYKRDKFFKMRPFMEKIPCDHCGKYILLDDIGKMYSIKVDSQSFSVEILHGLVLDALHYCCDKCMFERSEGMNNPNKF